MDDYNKIERSGRARKNRFSKRVCRIIQMHSFEFANGEGMELLIWKNVFKEINWIKI